MQVSRIPVSNITASLDVPLDVLICSASYESRCLSVCESLDPAAIRQSFVVANADMSPHIDANAQRLLARLGSSARQIVTSTADPLKTADALRDSIDAVANAAPKSLLVDITTFTHEALLILLRILQISRPLPPVRFLYTTAAEYSIGDTLNDKWLSKGVTCVRTVLGFPGQVLPSRPTHLILLVGYEYQRASRLIDTLEPRTLALGYGRSGTATTDKNRDANRHFCSLLKRTLPSFAQVEAFEIRCDNPIATRDILLAEARKRPDSNIVVAPMNNKMSTIGAALACLLSPDIQLCYAQASSYNYQNYSAAGHSCYLLDIPELFSSSPAATLG